MPIGISGRRSGSRRSRSPIQTAANLLAVFIAMYLAVAGAAVQVLMPFDADAANDVPTVPALTADASATPDGSTACRPSAAPDSTSMSD